MASQGSCEQSAAHLGGWGTGAGRGFPFPRVRARRESLQVGRAQGHCPGPSGVGQPAALEPLPRMRGRRAQPGSASRPRAGGLQGRVRLHVRGLPVPAGRSPGTPAAWGFEVCGGCLNLPARVDAAEDVCRASVWLSLPAGGGAEGGSWRVWLRVPPPGAGHVSLRAVCATCAGSCGAPGAGAGSPGGGKLCPGSISRGRSGCQVVITTHTHTSVSCLHFWGTWKEPEREEAAQTIPQSQEVLSARAHPQSSRGTVPLRA